MVGVYNYYPFGQLIENRTWEGSSARFGFQGQERDDEIAGKGNSLHYTARDYSTQTARMDRIDPLEGKFPSQSPYVTSGNSPISMIDVEGKQSVRIEQEICDAYLYNKGVLTDEDIAIKNQHRAQEFQYQTLVSSFALGGAGAYQAGGRIGLMLYLSVEGMETTYELGTDAPFPFPNDPLDVAQAGIIVNRKQMKSMAADATGTATGTVAKKVAPAAATGTVAKKASSTNNGIVYLRIDETDIIKPYVGQTKSDLRFLQRQGEHRRANRDADFRFFELDRGDPNGTFPTNLDMKEQKMLDSYGGPTNKSNPTGGTSNKKNVIKKQKEK